MNLAEEFGNWRDSCAHDAFLRKRTGKSETDLTDLDTLIPRKAPQIRDLGVLR